ncbi:DMT family transporter [Bifidobacterium crudilactis]|jgi:drug/metabolite transporter (DMT)-like permease|uniref:DMT family transporter n=1 Tax=Bifidobacterium crudilactis TaxID=327277 RepID=UPI00235363A0|nr:DMT family transporter [Bifidobacterium crudilactis]MCI1218481.1 DMT family transporter [Bifidobacterium crudilactis]
MSKRARAFLALVAATAFWAGNYVFGKVAVAGMSPFSIVFLRWAIALVPLAIVSQLIEHPDWHTVLQHWRFLLMQGLLGVFANNFLLYAALRVSTPFAASLINAANPALIALAAAIVLHERIGWRGGAGIVVALVGGTHRANSWPCHGPDCSVSAR